MSHYYKVTDPEANKEQMAQAYDEWSDTYDKVCVSSVYGYVWYYSCYHVIEMIVHAPSTDRLISWSYGIVYILRGNVWANQTGKKN